MKSSEYVAIYMINSPEMLLVWLGLLSIGAAPALINYNLASEALIHCIRLSGCRLLLHSSENGCAERIHNVHNKLTEIGVTSLELAGSVLSSVGGASTKRSQTSCFEESKMLPLALMYTR